LPRSRVCSAPLRAALRPGNGERLKRKETALNWNTRIRQTHRWLSIVFTLTVAANFIAMALGTPPSWLVYSPLPFLFLLMFSGLSMFALPYAAKRRSR
jgi:hypothetical protein